MSTPLLALGPHTFEVAPLNYQELTREVELRWALMNRLGAAPVYHAVGVGETSITIGGLLFPDAIGGWNEFRGLDATARAMQPVMMVAGSGLVFGRVVIIRVHEAHKSVTTGGLPRRLEFSIDIRKQG